MTDGFPSDGPPCPADDKAGDRAKFEKFNRSVVWDRVVELAAPAGVAESGETGAVAGGGGSGICVCFFVVVGWKMVESLKCVACVRMKANAIIAGAVKILEGVDGGFVVLVGWLIAVGGEEGETRGNIWAGAGGKPINASHYALVDFGASWLIGIVGGWRGDSVDRKARTVRSHGWSLVVFANSKAVSSKVGECRLAKMDRKIAVRVFLPHESGSKEPINIPHEVHNYSFLEF